MDLLHDFMKILCGRFDNREQKEHMDQAGFSKFPFAEHVNSICNYKIIGLPDNYGLFMVEESYYTVDLNTHSSTHLFLFSEDNGRIKLISYETPRTKDGSTFTYQGMEPVEFGSLKIFEKFTPAIYEWKNNMWEGGSVSMFTPVMKFTLYERFCKDYLEVTETIEVNGKKTFGYDEPIIYKRA